MTLEELYYISQIVYQRAPILDPAGIVSRWRPLSVTCSRCAASSTSLYDWPWTF